MVMNQKFGNKCAAYDIEQPGHEGKLDVSVIVDGSEALVSTSIWEEGFKFGSSGLKSQSDGYSVRNSFKSLCTEYLTGAGKDIFEEGFNFAASEARNNFNITASAVQREEYQYAYTSTQEYKKLEVKLKQNWTGV